MISYAQNMEDVILARVFREQATGFYVDIGAMDPMEDSVTKHFYDAGWSGINVEPNPQFYARLNAARPRDCNLRCCVSDAVETLTFHAFEGAGISSLDPAIAQHFEALNFQGQKLEVQTMTLADVLAGAPVPVDFLKVDVEGWELPVLRSNDWSLYRPAVILVEALDPRTLEPSWESWDPEVIRHGYRFVYFDGLNRFYVREDRVDLQGKFGLPPNLFDGVEPAVKYLRQRNEAQAELDQVQTQLQAAQQELALVQGQAQALHGQLEEVRSRVEGLANQASKARSERDLLHRTMEEMGSRLDRTQEALRQREAEVDLLVHDLREARLDNAGLRDELNATQEQLDRERARVRRPGLLQSFLPMQRKPT